MSRNLQLCSLFLACTTLSGCFWSRKKTARLPPPPAPAATHKSTSAHRTTNRSATASKAVRPPADARPAARTPVPAAPESAPAAPGGSGYRAPQPAPAPQLAEIYSPDEAAELTRNLNQGLATARRALSQIARSGLTVEQSEKAAMVKLLVSRAEAARSTDLSVAAQLARRAELLAQSLLNSMR